MMKNLAELKTISMTTMEIAELTGKQHKHVLADTRQVLYSIDKVKRTAEFSAVIKEVDFNDSDWAITYVNKQGKNQPGYLLNKKEVLILMAGYSIEVRIALVDRVEALENENARLIVENTLLLENEVERQTRIAGYEKADRIFAIDYFKKGNANQLKEQKVKFSNQLEEQMTKTSNLKKQITSLLNSI